MKTQIKNLKWGVVLLVSTILTGCSTDSLKEIEVENEVAEVESFEQLKAIPTLRLNHPTRGTAVSLKNDKFFRRSGSTFNFTLPKNNLNNRSRPQSRIEAFTHNQRKGRQTFSANFNVGTTLPGQVTVAQLFAVGRGPNVRIEVRSDNTLRAAFGNGNVILARKYNRKNFTIRMTTDGRRVSISLNGREVVKNRSLRYSGASNEWRWGLYYNSRNPRGIKATIKRVTIGT